MQRIRIALLGLTLIVLLGWMSIEFGGLGKARSDPPGGAHSIPDRGDDSSGTFHGVDPSLAPESPSARETVADDRGRVPTGTLLVRVSDRASGTLVEGASIALDPSGPASASTDRANRSEALRNPADETDAVTDELGEARIVVSSGIRIRMLVRDRGPEVGRSDLSIAPLAPGELREVLVDLPRGLELEHWVRVVADVGGEPVPGAAVRPIFAGEPFPPPADAAGAAASAAVLTDSEGLARLRVPSWRTALARVDAPGFGSRIAAVLPGHDAPPRAQVVALARSANLTATLASSPGIPLSGASLVLTLPASEIAIPRGTTVLAGDLAWSARTDEQGRCRIDDLPPEVPIRVEIRRGGELLHRIADPWIFSPGESAERSVCVAGAARLFGMVLGPESHPFPGAEIWIARALVPSAPAASAPVSSHRYFWTGNLEEPFAKTRSDEAGGFTFAGLEPGDWWLGPAPARVSSAAGAEDSIAPRAELVHIPAGATEVEVVLRASFGGWIRGRVLDPDDVPVAQTVVEARAEGALGAPSTRTTSDGSFALGPLAEGRFVVRAHGRWNWTDSAEATVQAGEHDLVLRLSPGATLRGRAIERETGAPCIATLHLSSSGSDGDAAHARSASAGRDGTFEFRGLASGAYDLLGRSDDGRVCLLRDVLVRLGETNSPTIVPLARGAKIRIRHDGKGAAGSYTVLCEGEVLAEGTARPGASILVVVPEGVVTVRCLRAGESAVEREIRAAAGEEETEVVF